MTMTVRISKQMVSSTEIRSVCLSLETTQCQIYEYPRNAGLQVLVKLSVSHYRTHSQVEHKEHNTECNKRHDEQNCTRVRCVRYLE